MATIFTSLYPRVMVASNDFANSLTVDDASSAHYTLKVSVVALVVAPIILLYQGWTYHVLRARAAARRSRARSSPPRAERHLGAPCYASTRASFAGARRPTMLAADALSAPSRRFWSSPRPS